MSENISIKNTSKYSKSIAILSWTSLVFNIIYGIQCFIWYDSNWVDEELIYTLMIGIRSINHLVVLILSIASNIIFLLYVMLFLKKASKSFFVSIVIGLFALSILRTFLSYGSAINIIFNFIFLIMLFVSVLCNLKTFSKKGIVIVTFSIGLIYEIYRIIYFIGDITWYIEELPLYLITTPALVISRITLYIAIILLCKKMVTKNKKLKAMSPEQALRALKNDYEDGIITTGEYVTKRNEIISKL